jgi:hypothetical protein
VSVDTPLEGVMDGIAYRVDENDAGDYLEENSGYEAGSSVNH